MGASFSGLREAFAAPPKFSPGDIPDLSGKLFIITGGNNGIGKFGLTLDTTFDSLKPPLGILGKETAKVLLQHNAKVYITCRSPEKAKEAVEDLKSTTGKTSAELSVLHLDLSNLASIKAAVDEYLK